MKSYLSENKDDEIFKEEIQTKLIKIYEDINKLKNQIHNSKSNYSIIDELFQKEIYNAQIKKKYCICFLINDFINLFCFKKKNWFIPHDYKHLENTIDDEINKKID